MKKYELVCHFCNLKIDDNNVNTGCHRNVLDSSSRGSSSSTKEGHTSIQVPIENVGNKRHFFGRPIIKNNDMNFNNHMLSSSSGMQFSQNFSSQNEYNGRSSQVVMKEKTNSDEDKLAIVLEKMKKIAVNKSTNVYEMFQNTYKESDMVSAENLKSFLKKNFQLDESEINKFTQNFKNNNLNNSLSNHTSSSSNQVSFQISEIFSFLKNKRLQNNYNDTKITNHNDSGVVFAGNFKII